MRGETVLLDACGSPDVRLKLDISSLAQNATDTSIGTPTPTHPTPPDHVHHAWVSMAKMIFFTTWPSVSSKRSAISYRVFLNERILEGLALAVDVEVRPRDIIPVSS